MAQINGIALRGVHLFEGQEGFGFSGNICLDGKAVGSVVDSAYGGSYEYHFKSKEDNTNVTKRIKEYYQKHPQIDYMKTHMVEASEFNINKLPKRKYKDMIEPEDCFFHQLLELFETERIFKRAVKKGGFIVVLDYYPIKGPGYLSETYTVYTDTHVDEVLQEGLKKSPAAYVKIYKDLKDFIL